MIGFNQNQIYPGTKNFSGVVNEINLKLKAVFIPEVIDSYLLKSRKGKYSILLDRDLFIDNSGIIL